MANVLYDALLAPHQTNDKPLLLLKDREDLSYQDLIKRAAQYAAQLAAMGAKAGDRVAVQVHKSAEAIALYAACLQHGCIFLPLNTAYTASEVEYFITDAKPAVLVCDDANKVSLQSIADANSCQLATLNADGGGSLHQQASTLAPAEYIAPRDADDLAAILYTSGTTGRSKGAMLTHRNLLSNTVTLIDYWQITDSDVLLHGLPIYHTHGLFVATNTTLLAGASCIFLPSFNTDDFINYLPQSTMMMGVPTFYTRLLADGRLTKELVSHMRLFISGSAPLLAETHESFESLTGQRILERYGMTETNMNTSNPYHGERRAGTVGFALPGVEARIIDPENDTPVGTDEIGVLEVRGENVFSGYWQMPEKTAQEFTPDGYFITGDLAKQDADGYIHIVGRDKDLIISGGFNIYPKEIELVLDEQTGVLESAVVAAPHADFGEGVVAILVAQSGQSIDIDAVKTEVAKTLAKFKQPKKYMVLDALPRNTMGKVQKNVLREQVADSFP